MTAKNPPKPAPSPRWERKAEDRPEALFVAAMKVFSDRGYRATRLEEVAQEAGVSKGTIYRYFRNKEELLEKTLEHRRRNMLPAFEAALAEFKGSSADKLRYFMDRCWQKCMSPDWGNFHRLIYGEIAHELPDLFEKWARQSLLRAWSMIEEILHEGQVRGEFRGDVDIKALARFLYSGLSHQALLRTHMRFDIFDPMERDRILVTTLDMALRGLRPDAPRSPAPSSPTGKKS